MNIRQAKIAIKSNTQTILGEWYGPGDDGGLNKQCAEICDLLDTLTLIKEEASKSNAPFGRSDTLSMDRIRMLLKDVEI